MGVPSAAGAEVEGLSERLKISEDIYQGCMVPLVTNQCIMFCKAFEKVPAGGLAKLAASPVWYPECLFSLYAAECPDYNKVYGCKYGDKFRNKGNWRKGVLKEWFIR